ncbi:MAG TPA: hypothetical protein VF929_03610 [Gemmatimonadaceae bacterium]
MRPKVSPVLLAWVTAAACMRTGSAGTIVRDPGPGERHLRNVRQLTNGGANAEAYFSADGRRIVFQSARDGRRCDQEYVMNVDGSDVHRISTGTGKTTCGFFYANDERVFFGSSHTEQTDCPEKPDASKGYVWRLDPYDIYTARPDGSDLRRLTNYGVYTAEGVVSPDGRTIVFTSLKDGDLDIYAMNVDGSNVHRLTSTPGYDGGPWWSPDGTKIVYRAWHPVDTALVSYRELLAQRLVRPNRMELWMMNADGSDQHQITHLGGANFGPSWTHDGRRLIFSSNFRQPRTGNFNLFLIDADGTGLEQVTTSAGFDGFPMFSPMARNSSGRRIGMTRSRARRICFSPIGHPSRVAFFRKVLYHSGVEARFTGRTRMTLPRMLKHPSGFLPPAMSLLALATVTLHVARFGPAPEPDEGAAAHIWQLLMVAQIPVIIFFAIKWIPQAPREALPILALQIIAVLAAMAPVFFLGL